MGGGFVMLLECGHGEWNGMEPLASASGFCRFV